MTRGRRFYKMSGSGNDFIVFDSRDGGVEDFTEGARIRRLCDRRQGVGADGVVIVKPSSRADLLMKYFNSDGSVGAMCGNAALCITRLAVQLGLANAAGMALETDDGVLQSRLVGDRPEIDLAPIRHLREAAEGHPEQGERRLGYVVAGVPHVVVLSDDVSAIDVATRGAALRRASWAGPEGANVNFVSQQGSHWALRTFERGVEAETLACGTGAVATATLLRSWGLAGEETSLRTRSGCTLAVALRDLEGRLLPRLRGEGRVVFEGRLGEV
ncbi:MAG TPA: diaminopimelate epimerase [Gemmatimonadaceae bacterium]|nr:diaminopimelate epimerase [Gemmatimonadaceae bacterium]